MKRTVMIIFIMSIVLLVGCSPQKELTEEQIANMSDEDIYVYYEEDGQAIAGEAVKTKRTSIITCSDGDSGKFFEMKGTTTATIRVGGRTLKLPDETDRCIYNNIQPDYSTLLTEFYCEGNKRQSVPQTCPQNCVNGACVKCYDTDDTSNIYLKRIVRNGITNTKELLGDKEDNCYYNLEIGKNVLAQYNCKDDGTGKVERTVENCPATSPLCGNGICKS